jgi:hypothetical protein
MRGGAQSHLILCSDWNLYVVKFTNNPQHRRVLCNEMLASGLARAIGLPVIAPTIVEVTPPFIRDNPELNICLSKETVECEPGLQFGSRYVLSTINGTVFDSCPERMLPYVENLRAFAGMLAFDKWTGNTDARQALYWKLRLDRDRNYKLTFIDHGHCFNAGEWNFPDHPLRGTCENKAVYFDIASWQSFSPWLSRIEHFDDCLLQKIADSIPAEWYENRTDLLQVLIATLLERRSKVRDLLNHMKLTLSDHFPIWQGALRKGKAGAGAA